MTRGKSEYLRNIKTDNHKMYAKPGGYKFRPERVNVLKEYQVKGMIVEEVGEQPM